MGEKIIDHIQIGHNPEGTLIALITPNHRYAWPTDDVPAIIKALRACAQGTKAPLGVKSMVFARGDGLIVLTDTPPNRVSKFIDGRPVMETNTDWSYVMPMRTAHKLADGFEETFSKLRPGRPAITAIDRLRDWRHQVATAVRSVKAISDGGGGSCFVRAGMGHLALTYLGIKVRAVMGGMIYRVGQDAKLDVVAFCGPGNEARLPSLYHAWLEADGHIIDFSCGDWREDAALIEAGSAVMLTSERGLRPISYEIDVPEYIWRPAAELTSPWRAIGTPELGVMWYKPGLRGQDSPSLRAYFDEAAEALDEMWPEVRAALPPPLMVPKTPTKAEARRLRQMHKRAKGRR